MGKLDLNIGHVREDNDSLFNGQVEDVTNGIKESTYALTNIGSDSVKTMVENSIHLIRHPWQSIFNKSNWGKLARTLPVVGMDLVNKAKSLPFRTLDVGIEYLINNPLERTIDAAKSVTTTGLANIITSNGKTDWKINKILGSVIEGSGDLVGSAIKVAPGLIGLGTNKLNKYVGQAGLETTDKWVKNLRTNEKDYFTHPIIENSNYNGAAQFQDVDFGNKGSAANDDQEVAQAA